MVLGLVLARNSFANNLFIEAQRVAGKQMKKLYSTLMKECRQ